MSSPEKIKVRGTGLMKKPKVARLRTVFFVAVFGCFFIFQAKGVAADLRVSAFLNASSVQILSGQQKVTLRTGDHVGDWTLVEVIAGVTRKMPSYAVLED